MRRLAAVTMGDGADGLDGLVDAQQDGPGLDEKDFAGLGERERFAGAAEEPDAEFLLEVADLAAERRLGDVQALGGAGDVFAPPRRRRSSAGGAVP